MGKLWRLSDAKLDVFGWRIERHYSRILEKRHLSGMTTFPFHYRCCIPFQCITLYKRAGLRALAWSVGTYCFPLQYVTMHDSGVLGLAWSGAADSASLLKSLLYSQRPSWHVTQPPARELLSPFVFAVFVFHFFFTEVARDGTPPRGSQRVEGSG